MDIYPHNLPARAAEEVRQLRAIFPHSVEEPCRVQGRRPGDAAGVGVGICVLIIAILSHILWLICVASGVIIVGLLGVQRARRPVGQRQERPLLVDEVRHAQQVTQDTVSRAYLDLVVAAIETPVGEESEASASVRDAIEALGKSIDALAPRGPHDPEDDPARLKAQADALRQEAIAEADPVVAASLQRRADALARQTDIAGQTAVLLRRNDALRQEVSVQIGALRTSLAALRIGGRQSAAGLADLASSIQTVAIEAAAVSQARAEIDGLVSQARLGT